MNHQADITNHGPAARWLIWIGATLVVSLAPLHLLFLEHLSPQVWRTVNLAEYEWLRGLHRNVSVELSSFGLLLSLALSFLIISPSVCSTFWASANAQRATLITFLPFSLLLALAAPSLTASSPFFLERGIQIPSWLAVTPPAGGALGVPLAYVIGVDRSTLATFSRRWLAGMALWLVGLLWNAFDLSLHYFPGWVGAAGATMILLGESLPRPAPRDS